MDLASAISAESMGWQGSGVPERAMTQAECDAIQASARGNGKPKSILKPVVDRPVPLAPTDDPVETRLAEEIEYAQRLLEVVGDRFVSDPVILQRHQTTMQSFDIIGQLLGHLAKVIGSKDKAEAIDRIGMQELRARMKRPSAGLNVTGTLGDQ